MYRMVGLIKTSFCFLKSMYSYHRSITRRRRSCPCFTAYLYPHKTIEDCNGTEEVGVELANNVGRIPYTGKTGWKMPHKLWLIETLPGLSQTKQDTIKWLPELCTAKTTWFENFNIPKFNISGKQCFGCVCFWSPTFPCHHFHYSQINLDWSVDKNMKDADHFFFYTIDLWPDSRDIIRYPTLQYSKYMLVNISMQ